MDPGRAPLACRCWTARPFRRGTGGWRSAVLAIALGLTAGACASTGPSSEPANGAPPAPSPDSLPQNGRDDDNGEPGLLDLCRVQPEQEDPVDEARRLLQETFCGATLWLDGLVGGQPDVSNARRTSGRVAVGAEHSDFHGLQPEFRLRLRYDLPNLSERLNIFLGRTDPRGFIEDREEGFALRTSSLDRRAEERWLTGLGYGPPGRWARDVDLRAGVRPGTSPDAFAQARYKRNVRVTDVSLWRFRETLFWEGREGFGFTTGLEYDRLLRSDLLLHWQTVATISEATAGIAWRTAAVAYHNLGGQRGLVGELFMLGATSAPVPLLEYGVRGVYRHPLRPYFFGELIAGYSWPRHDLHEERAGSPLVGLGAELHFGVRPF